MTNPGGNKISGRIISWALYDFANTIFSMNVVSLFFPLLIIDDFSHPDIAVSAANSISMLIVALTAPLFGQLTDKLGRSKPLLLIATLLCCLATLAIGILALNGTAGDVFWILILFVVANISYQVGLVFYNYLLPKVSPAGRMGRTSGIGVAFGYLGSIVGMILIMPFNEGNIFGMQVPFIVARGRPGTFIPTAILFFVFSLPLFIFLKEKKTPASAELEQKALRKFSINNSFSEIWQTLKDSKKYPGFRRFLIAKFFFQEGIETAIIFMGIYAEKAMGMPDSAKISFLVIATTGALIGSALFGIMTDRIGPLKTLKWILSGWFIALILLLPITGKIPFYIIGVLIGTLLGGVWTSSRPLLVKLAPPDSVGKFFGLYSLSGKVAAIIGPLIWGLVIFALQGFGDFIAYRGGVFSLALIILIGRLIINPLSTEKIELVTIVRDK